MTLNPWRVISAYCFLHFANYGWCMISISFIHEAEPIFGLRLWYCCILRVLLCVHYSYWLPLFVSVRSIVALNLHNYASGRNPWGKLRPEYMQKVIFTPPLCLTLWLWFTSDNVYFVFQNPIHHRPTLLQSCPLLLILKSIWDLILEILSQLFRHFDREALLRPTLMTVFLKYLV